MANETWTVGQQICIDNKNYEIQSVGRKYCTYGMPGGTYATGKFYLDTGIVVQNYGAPGRVYPSREVYEQKVQADQAWHRLRGLTTCGRPEHVTSDKIAQILEILQKP